ncbi:MAG: hypothetical protein ACTSPB_00375 [Candidatus Thorarchaeota archaeon]
MMGLYCGRCDEEFFDSSDVKDYKGIEVCSKCLEWFEENDGVTGKLIIVECGECGYRKGWRFEKYKQRGRPKGSKNKVSMPSVTMDSFGKDGV